MNVLDSRVLVLNRSWMPIDIVTVLDAVKDAFNGRALFVDPENYATYEFEDWVLTWDDAVMASKREAGRVVSTPTFGFLAPEVILKTNSEKKKNKRNMNRPPKFSRRNIYARDHNTCQYCGKKFDTKELSIDHIKPRCMGGKTTWTNTVLACVPCNDRKADRMLRDSGMRLLKEPEVPKPSDIRRSYVERLMTRVGKGVPESWEDFLGKMYWEVQLKD